MMDSDAWGGGSLSTDSDVSAPTDHVSGNTFENNFSVTSPVDKAAADNKTGSHYQPLPDSQEYLHTLEAKLKKVQSTSIGKALAERRSDEARRLLDSKVQRLTVDNELLDDAQIPDNLLLRRVFPEKQAVSQSELQKLVKKEAEKDTSKNDDVE